jgi:hypothetical protein
MSKKIFKVLCPMEGRNGTKYWSRLGSGFSNRDESINIYLDVIPFGKTNVHFQLREVTEEEQRRDAERRAAHDRAGAGTSMPLASRDDYTAPGAATL